MYGLVQRGGARNRAVTGWVGEYGPRPRLPPGLVPYMGPPKDKNKVFGNICFKSSGLGTPSYKQGNGTRLGLMDEGRGHRGLRQDGKQVPGVNA